MQACPVAAIRLETLPERRHRATDKTAVVWTEEDESLVQQITDKSQGPSFPRPFHGLSHVQFVGHHTDRSFGATPYLVQGNHEGSAVWILVDSPRFNRRAVEAVTSLTGPEGPNYLFLTHVDDVADHQDWADAFPNMKRIFHSTELENNWIRDDNLKDVEILLPEATPSSDALLRYSLDGQVLEDRNISNSDFEILHTPGHSRGSITLHQKRSGEKPGVVFTGDTYAYTTRDGGHMSGFPQYGNNLRTQAEIIQKLVRDVEWDLIAPGHGISRDYRGREAAAKEVELQGALDDLAAARRW